MKPIIWYGWKDFKKWNNFVKFKSERRFKNEKKQDEKLKFCLKSQKFCIFMVTKT